MPLDYHRARAQGGDPLGRTLFSRVLPSAYLPEVENQEELHQCHVFSLLTSLFCDFIEYYSFHFHVFCFVFSWCFQLTQSPSL